MDRDKKFVLNLKEFKDKDYIHDKNLDKLILFIVDLLEKNNIEPRLDHVAIAAFKLFPKKFSLPIYPEYPDVLRVDHCLLHCTYGNKWLDGGVKQGFKLNDKGKFILDEFKKHFLNKEHIKENKEIGKVKDVARRKERAIIEKIMKTDAYSYFLKGKITELNKDYLKEALRCAPDANKKELKDNYLKIHKYALEIEAEGKFLDFLNEVIKILEI